MAQNLPDPAPYAGGTPTAATGTPDSERQFGAANTSRSRAGKDIPLEGGGRDDPSQGMPYANSTNTCATDESNAGL
jgi:hypothetical protein